MRATIASEIPVLPLVGSSSSRPGSSSPRASAVSTMAFAIRSLTDPLGFWPSSFAYSRTAGLGASRFSSTSGVFPTRSRSELAATGHGREEDERCVLGDRGFEAVLRADVLTTDVDVHEGRDVAVFEDAGAEPGEALADLVEDLTDGRALRGDLALPLGVGAQG